MKIAGVRFRDNFRIYDFDATGVDAAPGSEVIVETDRGPALGRVVRVKEGEALPIPPAPPQTREPEPEEEIEIEIETKKDAEQAAAAAAEGKTEAKPAEQARGHRRVLRTVNEEDRRRSEKNQAREAEAFKLCADMIAERELPMKLIRAEYAFDGSRTTFTFFSETRVDFRELVKDLAHKLRMRIEMRQVGVRDVARLIGGFGPCGRELCCASFLRNFEPVSIRMAKKQDMVLNPAKISGVCGRLLCCLSYEYGMYDAIKKDLADMREVVVREKREQDEQRIAEQRREAEERKQAEDKRRQEEDRKRQEQKQRDRDRQRQPQQQREQKKQHQGQPKPAQPDKQRQRDRGKPQEPRQDAPPQQQLQQQPAGAEQQPTPNRPPQGEADAASRKKRRFWRKKKKKPGGPGPG